MSQPHASGSMEQKCQTILPTDSDNFQGIFESALEAYKKKTKQSPESHDLFTQLESCNSPSAILDLLRSQVNPNANDGLKKCVADNFGYVCLDKGKRELVNVVDTFQAQRGAKSRATPQTIAEMAHSLWCPCAGN